MATKLTEISAVNIILSNIGMAPVNTLDSNNPMVALAEQMLHEVDHAVQAEGWSFNTETDYPFNPTGGYVNIPDNVIQFDVQQYSRKDVILRSGRLYDKRAHKYVNEPIKLDVVWLFDFMDIPEVFKQYITIRAANLFAGRAVASAEAVKYSEREEGTARANCIEYETQQGDYNMLGTADNQKINTFLPFNVINR